MRKLAPLLGLTLFVLVSPSAARAEHPLAKKYLDGLFRAKPHLATFMGDHRFDDRLPDFSERALKAREKELGGLETLCVAPSTPTVNAKLDDLIDFQIMCHGVRLELLYLREI